MTRKLGIRGVHVRKQRSHVRKTLPHAICTELCIFACIPVQTYQAESDAMCLCITGICRYAAFWKRKQMYSLPLDIGVLVLWDFGA